MIVVHLHLEYTSVVPAVNRLECPPSWLLEGLGLEQDWERARQNTVLPRVPKLKPEGEHNSGKLLLEACNPTSRRILRIWDENIMDIMIPKLSGEDLKVPAHTHIEVGWRIFWPSGNGILFCADFPTKTPRLTLEFRSGLTLPCWRRASFFCFVLPAFFSPTTPMSSHGRCLLSPPDRHAAFLLWISSRLLWPRATPSWMHTLAFMAAEVRYRHRLLLWCVPRVLPRKLEGGWQIIFHPWWIAGLSCFNKHFWSSFVLDWVLVLNASCVLIFHVILATALMKSTVDPWTTCELCGSTYMWIFQRKYYPSLGGWIHRCRGIGYGRADDKLGTPLLPKGQL